MLLENELSAYAYEGAFVKVFEFNAVLVRPGGRFLFVFKLNIFDIECVLESEEE